MKICAHCKQPIKRVMSGYYLHVDGETNPEPQYPMNADHCIVPMDATFAQFIGAESSVPE